MPCRRAAVSLSCLVLLCLSLGCDDGDPECSAPLVELNGECSRASSDGGMDAGGDGNETGGGDGGGDVRPSIDAGDRDGGRHASIDASVDAGDGDGDGVECAVMPGALETAPCEPTPTESWLLRACCDEHVGGVCGASVPSLVGSPLHGCVAKHQPGNTSQHCAAFLDQLDQPLAANDPGDDGAYTFVISDDVVALPGCCTATGLCGVVVDDLSLWGDPLSLGLGCVPITRLTHDSEEADAGPPPVPPVLTPNCVPQRETDDAACPPTLTTVAGQNLCQTLMEADIPVLDCHAKAETPLWVCAALNLPTIDSGEVPSNVGACMEFLPSTMHGCGLSTTGEHCVPNVLASVAGCGD
jgi:hypothetical protein